MQGINQMYTSHLQRNLNHQTKKSSHNQKKSAICQNIQVTDKNHACENRQSEKCKSLTKKMQVLCKSSTKKIQVIDQKYAGRQTKNAST